MNKINLTKLSKLIKSCDFLGDDLLNRWIDRLPSLDDGLFDLIYETFLRAKHRADDFYMQIELSRNPKYKKVVRNKCHEIFNIYKNNKLKTLEPNLSHA